ncbi:MAG: hypothetical protein JJU12_00460 [Chlamydiales bacterium]|nr:hypothetical protein [Chlamydiales bacterium]
MNKLRIACSIITTFFTFGLLGSNSNCTNIEEHIEKVVERGERRTLGRQYKLLGDCYTSHNNKEMAQRAYIKALSFPYEALTAQERMEIAESLMDLGAVKFAKAELRKILQNEPDNQSASLLLRQYEDQVEELHKKRKEPSFPDHKLIETECDPLLTEIQEAKEKGHKGRLGYLYKQLGDCYAISEHQEEAVKAYEKARSYPYDALYSHARLEIAEYLGKTEHYKEALAELNKILRREPENLRALTLKAQFQSWSTSLDEAERNIDLVLEREPQNVNARLIKAYIMLDSEREKESIMLFHEILNEKDLTVEQQFDARYGLSAAYIANGQISRAESAMQNLQPRTSSQIRRVEMLEEKLFALKTTPAPDPKEVREEEILCSHYLREIQKAKRERRLDELASFYKELGDCYAIHQKRDLAADAYETAFSHPSRDLTIKQRIEMAAFLGNQDRYDSAITQLDKILGISPKNKQALILIARFHSWRGERGDQERAEIYIDRVLAVEPTNIEARIIKANVLTYTDRSKEAIEIYHDLLEKKYILTPEEIFWVRYGLALAYTNEQEYVMAEMLLMLTDAEFPYQETKIVQLRKGIREAKEKIPEERRAEQEKFLGEKVKWANALLNQRSFHWAMLELYEVLRCDPSDAYARLILARGLGLMGYYSEALWVLNSILCKDPSNVDAWVVKGMILRWKRNIPASTCAFCTALAIDEENFDARTGLAWTNLARGDQVAAYQMVATTPVTNSSQIQEVNDLCWEIALGPNFGFDYALYRDSDHIITEDYYADLYGYFKDYRIGLSYRHAYAEQPVAVDLDVDLVQRADAGYLEVTKFWTPHFDFGAGVGYAYANQDEYLLGRAFANYRTDTGSFYLSSTYDIFFPTAAAIFFEIRTWENLISYVNVLSGWWTVGGEYAYTYYTDSNHSNRFDAWVDYTLFRCPNWYLLVNYRFRFWDFADQIVGPFVVPGIFGGTGYFDPFNFFENRLGVAFIYDTKYLDIRVFPYTAYVTYRQEGRRNGFIYAGECDLEYRFSRKLSANLGVRLGTWPLRNLNYRYFAMTSGVDWYF